MPVLLLLSRVAVWVDRPRGVQGSEASPGGSLGLPSEQTGMPWFQSTDCGCCTIVSHVHVILCGSVVGEKSKANQALKGAANSVVKVLPKESNGNVIISRGILTRKLNGWHWQTTTQSNPLVGLSTRSVTGMYLRVL